MFLGYSFYVYTGECSLSVHPKSLDKFKAKLKELTGWSNGIGYAQRKESLRYFIMGWFEYFKLAEMKNKLHDMDKWYRRRLRLCIWKNWKRIRTRFSNFMKCGIERYQAWQWANTRKGYWHISKSWILSRALSSDNLRWANYPLLMDCYHKVVS